MYIIRISEKLISTLDKALHFIILNSKYPL